MRPVSDEGHDERPLAVRLFSVLRERTGLRRIELALDEPRRVAEILDRLVVQHPEIAPYRETMRAAVNMEYVDESYTVFNGDELAIITPVSGG